ncbi:Unknown protein, partial [Striga hermonthica]
VFDVIFFAKRLKPLAFELATIIGDNRVRYSETANDGLPYEVNNFLFGYHGQWFGFSPFSKVVDLNYGKSDAAFSSDCNIPSSRIKTTLIAKSLTPRYKNNIFSGFGFCNVGGEARVSLMLVSVFWHSSVHSKCFTFLIASKKGLQRSVDLEMNRLSAANRPMDGNLHQTRRSALFASSGVYSYFGVDRLRGKHEHFFVSLSDAFWHSTSVFILIFIIGFNWTSRTLFLDIRVTIKLL